MKELKLSDLILMDELERLSLFSEYGFDFTKEEELIKKNKFNSDENITFSKDLTTMKVTLKLKEESSLEAEQKQSLRRANIFLMSEMYFRYVLKMNVLNIEIDLKTEEESGDIFITKIWEGNKKKE